jgi:hypothetical protein
MKIIEIIIAVLLGNYLTIGAYSIKPVLMKKIQNKLFKEEKKNDNGKSGTDSNLPSTGV